MIDRSREHELDEPLERLLQRQYGDSVPVADEQGQPIVDLANVAFAGARFLLICVPSAEKKESLLTHRQKEIAMLVGNGLGNKGIARQLGLSELTVANHLKRIFTRLGINSRAALSKYAAVVLSRDTEFQDGA